MGQLEAKVESHFHIETGTVDGYARVVDCIKEWPEGRAVLCAYSTPRSLASRSKKVQDEYTDSRCGTSSSGVLAVDIEHGEVLWDAGFMKVDDKTLYMNIVGVGDKDSSSIRQIAICLTDGGGVWGVDIDVKGAPERNVHFLGNIAAMFLNGQSRITSYIEKVRNNIIVSKNQGKDNVVSLEEEERYDSGGEEKNTNEPEFISESGYRGPREGYTFWTNERGENGYYRNDVMKKILEKDLNASKIRDDASEERSLSVEKKECLDSESGPVCSYRRFIRCFEYLDKLKQFVIASVGSEDGTIYTGRLDMIESSASLLTVEAEVKRDVAAHESGVLVFASTTDQKVVASGSYDQKIKIWDTSHWNCLKTLSGHGGGIKNLLFTPDDRIMISTSSDNTIRLWSCAAWLCLRHLHGRHEDTTWPVCLDFGEANDGTEKGKTCTIARKLVVSGSNGLFGGSTLKLFDFESGDCLANFAQLRFDHKGSCSAIKLLHGGKLVISAATDGTLAGWKCSLAQKQAKTLKKGFFG